MAAIRIVEFKNYRESVYEILNLFDLNEVLKENNGIILKPNLVNASRFPVTTPCEFCEAVVEYLKERTDAQIIIAEGCGEPGYETGEIFEILGYGRVSKKFDVSLVDLNHEPLVRMENKSLKRFPEMYLPEILFENYLISLPVLKAHSLSVITGTLKNMVGAAPPKYYSEKGGIWRKSSFHLDIHNSVKDLNYYRTPDFSIMDATVGLSDYHLGGSHCNPPVNKILAGFDSVEFDRAAAKLLGIDYRKVPHLN